jgi:hypothetical protein
MSRGDFCDSSCSLGFIRFHSCQYPFVPLLRDQSGRNSRYACFHDIWKSRMSGNLPLLPEEPTTILTVRAWTTGVLMSEGLSS